LKLKNRTRNQVPPYHPIGFAFQNWNWTQNWKLESSNKYFLELEQEVLQKSKEPHNNAILCTFVYLISMVVVTIDKYLKLFINEI